MSTDATDFVLSKTDTTDIFQTAMQAAWDVRALVPDERITTDEHGLVVAMSVALRADCTRRRVGTLIVDVHGRTVDTGRNGAPPGRPGCLTEGACPRGKLTYDQVAPGSTYSAGAGKCIALHAEVNALIHSDPLARLGGTIYITDPPCDDCSTALAGSGLRRAVWPEKTEDGFVIKSILIAESPVGGYLK
jgi:dCMP deaminase